LSRGSPLMWSSRSGAGNPRHVVSPQWAQAGSRTFSWIRRWRSLELPPRYGESRTRISASGRGVRPAGRAPAHACPQPDRGRCRAPRAGGRSVGVRNRSSGRDRTDASLPRGTGSRHRARTSCRDDRWRRGPGPRSARAHGPARQWLVSSPSRTMCSCIRSHALPAGGQPELDEHPVERRGRCHRRRQFRVAEPARRRAGRREVVDVQIRCRCAVPQRLVGRPTAAQAEPVANLRHDRAPATAARRSSSLQLRGRAMDGPPPGVVARAPASVPPTLRPPSARPRRPAAPPPAPGPGRAPRPGPPPPPRARPTSRR
jgi:hypothetical protein